MGFFNRDKKEQVAPVIDEDSPESTCTEPEAEEQWIWVEGIKGMSVEMRGMNDFQFEVGKTYVFEGEPKLCERGFHFSPSYKYAKLFYSSRESRYFRVRGLVRKSEYDHTIQLIEDSRAYAHGMRGDSSNMINPYDVGKLVAKEIEITSEFSEKEYLAVFTDCRGIIDSMEDVREVWRLGSVYKLGQQRVRETMLECGYGETFINIVIEECSFDESLSFARFINLAKALKEENVSKDMSVYLLLKEGK